MSRLIWPRFQIIHGCLIRDRYGIEKQCISLLAEGHDRREIEATLNHIHLWDVVSLPEGKADEVYWKLAEFLRYSWSVALLSQYPDRPSEIRLVEDYGPTLTIVQSETGLENGAS